METTMVLRWSNEETVRENILVTREASNSMQTKNDKGKD